MKIRFTCYQFLSLSKVLLATCYRFLSLSKVLLATCYLLPVSGQRPLTDLLDFIPGSNQTSSFYTGVCIYDLTADSMVYALDAGKQMRPASTQKLFTAIAALDQLGHDHPYETYVYALGPVNRDSTGLCTLDGNVLVVGDFDPLLVVGDVDRVLHSLKQDGIARITGTIMADLSMKDTILLGSGWCWDDDNPRLSPLPKDFTQHLADVLRRGGIAIDGSTVGGGASASPRVVYRYHHSLSDVLQRMMKNSDNTHAESMFYQLGAQRRKCCSSKDCAAQVGLTVSKALDEFSHSASCSLLPATCSLLPATYKYTIADGSGLSLYNYTTPLLEVIMLRYAYTHPEIFQTLYPSLPVAGVDGTLAGRMQTPPLRGNVHAKTGTVNHVSSLAGYLTSSDGHMLAFSIICNGVPAAAEAKALQDKICRILTQ